MTIMTVVTFEADSRAPLRSRLGVLNECSRYWVRFQRKVQPTSRTWRPQRPQPLGKSSETRHHSGTLEARPEEWHYWIGRHKKNGTVRLDAMLTYTRPPGVLQVTSPFSTKLSPEMFNQPALAERTNCSSELTMKNKKTSNQSIQDEKS